MTTEHDREPGSRGRTWTEEIELAGSELVARVQELIAEGNVRWLIIRHDGRILLQIPITVAAAGAAALIFTPVLAALTALAAVVARVQVSIVREGEPPQPPPTGPGEGI